MFRKLPYALLVLAVIFALAPVQPDLVEAQSRYIEVNDAWSDIGGGYVTIHVDVVLHGCQGCYVWIGLWPHYRNGNLIPSQNSSYMDPSGYITVQAQDVYVQYADTRWTDLSFRIAESAFPTGNYDWDVEIEFGLEGGGGFIDDAMLPISFNHFQNSYHVSLHMNSMVVGDVEEEVTGDDEIVHTWGLVTADGVFVPGKSLLTTVEEGDWLSEWWGGTISVDTTSALGISMTLTETEDWSRFVQITSEIDKWVGRAVTIAEYMPLEPSTMTAVEVVGYTATALKYSALATQWLDGNDTLMDDIHWYSLADLDDMAGSCWEITVEPHGSSGWFGYDNYRYTFVMTMCVTKNN